MRDLNSNLTLADFLIGTTTNGSHASSAPRPQQDGSRVHSAPRPPFFFNNTNLLATIPLRMLPLVSAERAKGKKNDEKTAEWDGLMFATGWKKMLRSR